MQNGAVSLFVSGISIINLAYVVSAQWVDEDKKSLKVYMVNQLFHTLGPVVGKEFIEALLLYHDTQNKEK